MSLFSELAQQQDISVAQSTIICTMMLIAHGLPVEGSIAHKTGVRFSTNVIFRFVCAFVLGFILNQIYSFFNMYQHNINLIWKPEISDQTLIDWLLVQFYNLIAIAIIVLIVIFISNLIKRIGIEEILLKPVTLVLRTMGIDKKTAGFNFVGLILGITYGAGLLIKEAKQEHIDKRNVASSMSIFQLRNESESYL
ncbi:MAG: hypothetical protein GY738_04425, partial [Pseudoalteromonas sp.]|nr:hypothetical protein [Pseudoalteromonas sp.]